MPRGPIEQLRNHRLVRGRATEGRCKPGRVYHHACGEVHQRQFVGGVEAQNERVVIFADDRIPPSHRRHVGPAVVRHPVHEVSEGIGKQVDVVVDRRCARRLPVSARADEDQGLVPAQRVHLDPDVVGIVEDLVGVEKHQVLATGLQEADVLGEFLLDFVVRQDGAAVLAGDRQRVIGRAAVDEQHLDILCGIRLTGDRLECVLQRALGVQRRHDDADERVPIRLHRCLGRRYHGPDGAGLWGMPQTVPSESGTMRRGMLGRFRRGDRCVSGWRGCGRRWTCKNREVDWC